MRRAIAAALLAAAGCHTPQGAPRPRPEASPFVKSQDRDLFDLIGRCRPPADFEVEWSGQRTQARSSGGGGPAAFLDTLVSGGGSFKCVKDGQPLPCPPGYAARWLVAVRAELERVVADCGGRVEMTDGSADGTTFEVAYRVGQHCGTVEGRVVPEPYGSPYTRLTVDVREFVYGSKQGEE